MRFFFHLCRKSASCTHVSAVLHALVTLTTTGFQLQPALPSTSLPDEEDAIMPVTSYLCQWMVPTVFKKRAYRKQKKRKLTLMEDFDPQPEDCRGTAASHLPTLLDSLHDESLGVSLLFDPQCCQKTIPLTQPGVPDTPSLKETVSAFKDSLKVLADKLRDIKQNIRDQRHWNLL